MVRQVTSNPTGGFTEEVTVVHPMSENWSGFANGGQNAEVVRVGCGASTEGGAAVGARRYRAQTPTGPDSSAPGAEVSFDCSDPSGRCDEKKIAKDLAYNKLQVYGVIVFVACLIPEPAEPAACAAAWAALAIAQLEYNAAKKLYDECMAAPTPPGGVDPILSIATTRNISLSAVGSTFALGTAKTSGVQLSCGDSGGGGYGGGGSGQTSCHIENWEISYDDGATWEPIQIEVCE
jgi:hypothetical protein